MFSWLSVDWLKEETIANTLASDWNRLWSCRWCPSVTISRVLIDNHRSGPDLDPVRCGNRKKNLWFVKIREALLAQMSLNQEQKRRLCCCIHYNIILKIKSLPVFWKGLQRADLHFDLHTSSHICKLFWNTSRIHQAALTAEPHIKSFLCLLATFSSCGIISCTQLKNKVEILALWKETRPSFHL